MSVAQLQSCVKGTSKTGTHPLKMLGPSSCLRTCCCCLASLIFMAFGEACGVNTLDAPTYRHIGRPGRVHPRISAFLNLDIRVCPWIQQNCHTILRVIGKHTRKFSWVPLPPCTRKTSLASGALICCR